LGHSYSIMNNLQDIIIVIGMSSVALLWAFSIVGGLSTLWDTFGEHAAGLVERLKR